jgi:hypothetical protein
LGTANLCGIEVTGMTATGTHDVAAPPNIAIGERFSFTGDNHSAGDLGFETHKWTGSATDCSSWSSLDDGAVAYIMVLVATA